MELTEICEFIVLFLSGLGLHLYSKIKKRNNFLKIIKFFWIFMILASFNSIVNVVFLSSSPELYRALPLSLLYGPFLLFSLSTMVKKEKLSLQTILLHLVPFITCTLLYIYYAFNAEWRLQYALSYHLFLYGIVLLSCIAYSFFVFFQLSNLPGPNRHPALLLSISVVLFWIYCIYLFMTIYHINQDNSKLFEISTFTYIIVIRVLVASMVFITTLQVLIRENTNEKSKPVRQGVGDYLIGSNVTYSQSQLSIDKMYKLIEQFEELMFQQRSYLNYDLSLDKLAMQLDIPPHQLTQLLSRAYGMSILELINRMRIKYACQLIKEQPNISTPKLISDCGYSSESTFFRNFKTLMDVSPTQYRQAVIEFNNKNSLTH